MIIKLIWICMTFVQFVRQGGAVAATDINNNATVDETVSVTPKSSTCDWEPRMERYGLCADGLVDETNSNTYNSKEKHAEMRKKCTKLILNLGQMKLTRILMANWTSEFSTVTENDDSEHKT